MIRVLIVDDEPLARRHIRNLLAGEDGIAIAGEAANGSEAIELIGSLKPDLVFLDVQMPEISGFDVIAAVGAATMPPTVFVTAHDNFAVRAFEVQALDYLLKPFDDRGLARVMARVRRRGGGAARLGNLLLELPPKLIARSRGVTRVIYLDEIEWIGAAGDYAEVHTNGRSLLVDDSLASLAARLPPDQFSRIHRSAIVKLDKVREIRPGEHGDASLILTSGTQLRLSRRFRADLARYLAG